MGWRPDRTVNLLTNAVRYGSGTIAVETDAHDGQMTVVVANEGNPIPEHALPTLFDPLTRAGSPDRRGMAAGLGLSPVHLPLHCVRAPGNNQGGFVGTRHPFHSENSMFALSRSHRARQCGNRRSMTVASALAGVKLGERKDHQ